MRFVKMRTRGHAGENSRCASTYLPKLHEYFQAQAIALAQTPRLSAKIEHLPFVLNDGNIQNSIPKDSPAPLHEKCRYVWHIRV